MPVVVTEARVSHILTRTSGFLRTVSSHLLQYRGCTFGRSLCGVGCYVQHNRWVTRGAPWGGFLEARTNAGEVYREQYETERRWAQASRGRFVIFLSSSTEPFVPQEERLAVTRRLLEAMLDRPPDGLIVQTLSSAGTARPAAHAPSPRRCRRPWRTLIRARWTSRTATAWSRSPRRSCRDASACTSTGLRAATCPGPGVVDSAQARSAMRPMRR
jgi:hypothetical protein